VKSIIVLCPDRFDIFADTLERSGCLVGFTHFKLITVILRVVDPDPYWIRIQLEAWIRIRIRNLNTDPDPGGLK
jgi:hypothetical protein